MLRALSLITIILSAAIPVQAQNSQPLIDVAPGVYAFGQQATSLAVVTETGVVVIDPINNAQAAGLDAALDGVTDLPVTHVLYSHNHWDHIAGAGVFVKQGAIVISHADAKADIKPNPDVVPPQLTWSGARFDLTVGGTTIELHHFGPSHGAGMTVFNLPAQQTAFVIDIATAGRVYPLFMPDFDIDGLVKSLEDVRSLEFEQVVFGHGEASGGRHLIGTKDDIAEVAAYLDALINGVRNAMMSGGFPAVTQLELPQWQHMNMYEDWFPQNAMRIVIALGMGH